VIHNITLQGTIWQNFTPKTMLIYRTPQDFILKLDNNICFKTLQLFYKKKIVIYRLKVLDINGCKQDKVNGSLLCVKKITSSHENNLMYGK
jgi:hypothetical protein